jgi:hypothetical protein
MNNEQGPPDFNALELPLETAVKTTLAEPVPEDALQRVKVRAKQLAAAGTSPSPAPDSRKRKWNAVRSIIWGLTAAAAILAVIAGALSLLDYSGGRAFAQMIEKVKAISSVRFNVVTQFGWGPETKGVMYLEGNRLRQELANGILIEVCDMDRKQALFLDTHSKTAQTVDVNAKLASEFDNPIEQLRHAQSKDAAQIGEEILNGHRTRVYRLRKVDLLGIKGDAEMLVWVDVASELPAKIVIHDTNPEAKAEFRFEEFVWNGPLAPGLFALTVPDGYHKGEVMLTPRRPEPTQPGPAPVTPTQLAEGILSRDRVPATILWNPQGTTITALLRDPESVSPMERRANELRQWDVATGKIRWSESIHGASSLAGTVDGKTLAIVIGYEVQLRDAASGKIVRKWTTDKPLSPLAFSPDGKRLAAGITEWGPFGGRGGKPSGGVQIWDTEGQCLVRSIDDDKPTTFVRCSVDGKYLATSGNDGPVKVLDAATGELTRILLGRGPAAFSPDGSTVACAAIDSAADKMTGKVELYNLHDGSLVKSFTSEKGKSASYLLSVNFSPNGRLLVAADWNGTVTLWDVATGQRKLTIADQKVGVLVATFAPDGATLATGSEDKTLRLHKLPTELVQPSAEKK